MVEKFDDALQALQSLDVKRLHKTFAFIGMKPMASFMANDVFKNPTIAADFERYKAHLAAEFAKLA